MVPKMLWFVRDGRWTHTHIHIPHTNPSCIVIKSERRKSLLEKKEDGKE